MNDAVFMNDPVQLSRPVGITAHEYLRMNMNDLT